MISPIKDGKPKGSFSRFLSSLPLYNKMFSQTGWKELIKDSKTEKINEMYIKELLSSYDTEHLRFNCIISRTKKT